MPRLRKANAETKKGRLVFTFKIDPKDIEKTKLLLEQKFYQVIYNPAMLKDQGTFVAERIRYQARITMPINDQQAFPPLKENTFYHRKYLAKYNDTAITYAPARSNLTLTGAFFNSLGFDITAPGEVTLTFKGQHPPYKGKKGVIKGKPLTNKKLARYLRENGFDPFTIDALRQFKPIRARIKAITRTYLRRALRLG